MPNTANKIKYGIRSLYYAVATDDGTGNLSYATPVEMKGAVSLSLDESSENNIFYADDIAYFTSYSNNGYSNGGYAGGGKGVWRKLVLRRCHHQKGTPPSSAVSAQG